MYTKLGCPSLDLLEPVVILIEQNRYLSFSFKPAHLIYDIARWFCYVQERTFCLTMPCTIVLHYVLFKCYLAYLMLHVHINDDSTNPCLLVEIWSF